MKRTIQRGKQCPLPQLEVGPVPTSSHPPPPLCYSVDAHTSGAIRVAFVWACVALPFFPEWLLRNALLLIDARVVRRSRELLPDESLPCENTVVADGGKAMWGDVFHPNAFRLPFPTPITNPMWSVAPRRRRCGDDILAVVLLRRDPSTRSGS